jgi:hypothetical protein
MAQSAPEEQRDPFAYFPTHPWATRGFVEHVLRRDGVNPAQLTVWEPAAGEGYMARPLSEYFGRVIATDIKDYGYRGDGANGAQWLGLHDFLMPFLPDGVEGEPIDWIISNPPFPIGFAFVERALGLASQGVAMVLRSQFLEGIDRHRDLYCAYPPNIIAQSVERIPMVKGRLDAKANTATSYSWFIWYRDERRRAPMSMKELWAPVWWIPPCRDRLKQKSDYPAPPEEHFTSTPAEGTLL